MLNIIRDNVRVNRFFRNDFRFIDDLTDEVKTYRQHNGEIAVVIDLIHEEITEETLQYFQVVCESLFFKYEIPINMYVITLGCKILVKEHPMKSIAKFSIKLCCRDYSEL